MLRLVALVAAVGVFAGAAVAQVAAPVHGQLAFARLQSPSFGTAAVTYALPCGATCTSYRPHLFVTDHGGWREVTPPHVLWQLESVVFATPLVGWVVANDCVAGKADVYRTSDGGRTWRSTPVRATNCSAGSRLELTFSDNEHGWLLDVFENGNGNPLARTSDGGTTWHDVTSASGPPSGAIVSVTPRDGWASRADFASPQGLSVTRDGGRTWQHRTLDAPLDWTNAKLFPDAPTFFGTRGVLPVDVARGTRSAVAFYTTSDGGRSWRPAAVRLVRGPILSPSSVQWVPTSVVSPSVWWVAVGHSIAVTSDGGTTWRTSTVAAGVSGLSAADARRAWVTTTTHALYATSDGGHSWHRLALPRR